MKSKSQLSIRIFGVFLASAVLISITFSCKKKKTNQNLYEESTSARLTFYKNKDTLYGPKGGSPHGSFKIKINDIVKTKLNAEGKLPLGEKFDEGAVIVKEAYKNGKLDLYAIMKKDKSSKFAGEGWIWAEYGPDGSTIIDATRRGSVCTGCHSSASERDFVLTFDLH
jgi:hypothetical protein